MVVVEYRRCVKCGQVGPHYDGVCLRCEVDRADEIMAPSRLYDSKSWAKWRRQ